MSSAIDVAPIVAPDHACAIAGVSHDLALRDGSVLGRSLIDARERYGHDLVLVFVDVCLEAEAVGAILDFSGRGTHVDTPVDFGAARWDYDSGRGRLHVLFDAIEECRSSLPEGFPIAASLKGPFSLAALAMGMERFIGSILSDPRAVAAEVDAAAMFQAEHARAIAALGVMPWFGDPVASADVLGEKWFRKFALRPLTAAVQAARAAAGTAAVHVCGDPMPIAAAAAESGADWLSLEMRDPPAIRAMAKGPVLFGGVPTRLLSEASPFEIRLECAAIARSLPDNCVAATDCDVPVDAPPENVAAMVQGCREGLAQRAR